jgi:hypothetical protein
MSGNLKFLPFDLEKYRAGHPAAIRSGHRIVDREVTDHANFPVRAKTIGSGGMGNGWQSNSINGRCHPTNDTAWDILLIEEDSITEASPTSTLEFQVGGDHYKNLAIQPVIFCERNNLSACESSVVKYVCRHRAKGGRKDLEKAIHYLQILIEEEYPNEWLP